MNKLIPRVSIIQVSLWAENILSEIPLKGGWNDDETPTRKQKNEQHAAEKSVWDWDFGLEEDTYGHYGIGWHPVLDISGEVGSSRWRQAPSRRKGLN